MTGTRPPTASTVAVITCLCSSGVREYISPVPPAATIAQIECLRSSVRFCFRPLRSRDRSFLKGVIGNAITPDNLVCKLESSIRFIKCPICFSLSLSLVISLPFSNFHINVDRQTKVYRTPNHEPPARVGPVAQSTAETHKEALVPFALYRPTP